MNGSRLQFCVVLQVLLACILHASHQATAAEDSFNRDVRPLLAKNCFACHGRDAAAREADLRLDQRADAISAGAITPGDPAGSELIARIISDDPEEVMPPPTTGHKLTPANIQTLKAWIASGAKYEQHWSFTPPVAPRLPAVTKSDWPRTGVDYFILQKLESAGLTPQKHASRRTLFRRVALDLTGLPPTPAEADAFVADDSPDAYERVVDRLLASPAFGERWARMWLDLARYADTKGYEKDRHREIWRYRDWVIGALNRDMPYDQFTREQLAGDLLPEADHRQILATAFHRNTMTNEEGGTDNEEFRVKAVKDRVDTTLQVWMGLTMGCAKCHSHKYDPVSIKDYYAFYACFNQTQDNDAEAPFHASPTLALEQKIRTLENRVALLQQRYIARPADFGQKLNSWKRRFATAPLWQTLRFNEFVSQKQVLMSQDRAGVLIARGPRPAKDVWTLSFRLPAGAPLTALRIDHLPAKAGGEWPDANIAIRELTANVVSPSGETSRIKLTNPRATFSQRGWEVAQAIDGKTQTGWALAPQFKQRQAAVFDFAKPVAGGSLLQITLDQQYGQSLLLARSKFSVSTHPVEYLRAVVKPDLAEIFAKSIHPVTSGMYTELQQAKAKLDAARREIPQTPVMLELSGGKHRVTRIHQRGNFLDQGEVVAPGVLTIFGKPADGFKANRLGVADWLMQPGNPLTARVMVNRLWARLFGVGLVETEEDFGTQGASPSHPQLLDWLAVQFRDGGWSVKRALRTMVLSATYRQSAAVSEDRLRIDPRNRLLSRGPRFRLPAETVRDQALAVSGLLNRNLGGPSVMPPQPGGVWKSTYSGESWKNATGANRYRRGLYTYLKRTSPYPAMLTFDAGSGEVCQIRRVRTNTPLQALVTLNDVPFIEAAGALSKRMQKAGETPAAQIAAGFERVLLRKPAKAELQRLLTLYNALAKDVQGDKLLQTAGIDAGDARLVAVANVLLNLDETLTRH